MRRLRENHQTLFPVARGTSVSIYGDGNKSGLQPDQVRHNILFLMGWLAGYYASIGVNCPFSSDSNRHSPAKVSKTISVSHSHRGLRQIPACWSRS